MLVVMNLLDLSIAGSCFSLSW